MQELSTQSGKRIRRIAILLAALGTAGVLTNTNTGLLAGGAAIALGVVLLGIGWLID